MINQNNALYLAPAFFINSGHPDIIDFAKKKTAGTTDLTKQAVLLYYAVRDGWRYNPYQINLKHEAMMASNFLQRDSGYCVEKACLYAALTRAIGIPSRLGFANVKNHIGTEKLEEYIKTDVLVFHGYTELFLNGKWVKATSAFNKELCDKLGVPPLEFDGKEDSVFQEYDRKGGDFMEYLHDYGVFHDVPHDMFVLELQRYYPHLFENKKTTHRLFN